MIKNFYTKVTKFCAVSTTSRNHSAKAENNFAFDAALLCPSGYQRFEEGARGKQGVASHGKEKTRTA